MDHRNNPAQANRWNAWRFPTLAEIANGRAPHDMFWVGARLTKAEALRLLDGDGQLQWGVDGEVVNP